MNSKLVFGGVVIVIIGAVGFFALQSKDSSTNSNTSEVTVQHNNKSTGEDTNADQQSKTNKITIRDFAFSPAKTTVKKGTTVTWTNQDDARHDIAPDQESENFKGSELLERGQSYSYTFDKVGMYSYHCTPHPYMKATIEVIE